MVCDYKFEWRSGECGNLSQAKQKSGYTYNQHMHPLTLVQLQNTGDTSRLSNKRIFVHKPSDLSMTI
jgi:hypothetical protein